MTDASEVSNPTDRPSCPVPGSSPSASSVTMRRRDQDGAWKVRLVYLQCYFLSVATILGTGILGLPVTIAQPGMTPFLVSFLIGFLIQALLIYFFVELLQKCQLVQAEFLKSAGTERIRMEQVVGEEQPPAGCEEEEDEEEEDEGESAEADTGLLKQDATGDTQSRALSLQPNLHLLGLLFLSRPMSHAFDCILLLHFVSIGISYVLAGSEAYAALFNIRHTYVIPAFTWILALAVLLAQFIIQPLTSLLTLLKGILLIVTVAVTFAVGSEVSLQSTSDFSQMGKPFLMGTVALVTFAVGSEVSLQSTSDFSQMGKPFLMGTVALGGIVNVMPLLFSQISYNRTQILWFRRAVLAALMTCLVLNILWCWAVLEIVPQTSSSAARQAAVAATSGVNSSGGVPSGFSAPLSARLPAYSNISLEESQKAGEIATIPLTKIIREKHSAYCWVAELIRVFIAISITVSFLVIGSALKHTIDGLVNAVWTDRLEWLSKAWERRLPTMLRMCSAQSLAQGSLALLVFVVIFIVSACDPRGFVVMLDKVVSFSLNAEAGLFIFLMLRASRAPRFQHLSVPLPVGRRVFGLTWLLPTYFLFAVAYDVLVTAKEAVDHYTVDRHAGPLQGPPAANQTSPL